jgi:hypothetical protein
VAAPARQKEKEEMFSAPRIRKLALRVGLLAGVLAIASSPVLAQKEIETIDAQAYGTSTQLGKNVSIRLLIYQYSTQADTDALVQAFHSGGNDGLNKALSKMKAVGRIQMPGSVGYEVSYIHQTPTSTGRNLRFVTNRLIKFKEAYHNTRSQAYNLTAGEININDQEKDKSDGVFYPATQLVINKDGQLEFNLYKDPWRLSNIIDWNKDKQ